ncbi:VirB4 family type IV secretion/conjugal transfer ATPase [Cronobacter sakazakii]|nr:VirB4 family type IV secretion/conjugal transfer ATPase [Cronobacter sakazakii]
MKQGLFSFRKDDAVSKFLPFSYHLTDSVISLKSYEFMSIIKISGKASQTKDEKDIYKWIEQLNSMLVGVANPTVELYSYIIRRDMMKYPDGEYEGFFAKSLNDKYKEQFEKIDIAPLKVNELYLAVVYKPFGSSMLSGIKKKTLVTYDAVKEFQAESIKELESLTSKFVTGLNDYNCELLTTYSEKTPGDNQEVVYSAPMELMSYILNGVVQKVPLTKKRFASSIPNVTIKFSKYGEFGVRTLNGSSDYIGMVDLADYDSSTYPGQLNYLLESDFSFVAVNSISLNTSRGSEGFLKNHIKFMKEQGDVGVTQIKMMERALDELKSNKFCMGLHHCTVMVTSSDFKEVKRNLETVANDLSRHKIIMKQATKSLEAAFWAQFPGNRHYRPRAKPVTSYNFWCFSSFHNFLTGKPDGNPWGSAVTAFKTDSRTPFFFNFHDTPLGKDSTGVRALGHTGIFGKTGAGKTALLNFLLTMLQKTRPNGIIFDKDRGMENAIRAMGGVYNPVLYGVPTGWNPFQLDPTLDNIRFLKDFVEFLAKTEANRALSEEHKRDIEIAVNSIMHKAEKHKRNLSTLNLMLPPGDESKISVSKLLYPWIDGDKKWIFNNLTDNLHLGKGYYGFDTTDLISNESIRVPILKYLTHRGDEMINGEPFLYVFEECWNFCQDDFFQKLIKDKLKTIRKNNGIVVFSTQEPNDVLSSPIGPTFAASLATKLILRNDNANFDDYRKLGLSDVEINMIVNMRETDRRFIVKQSHVSAVARFDLSAFRDEMKILSGSEDTAIILNECIASVGEEPELWLPVFYERMRKEMK